MTVGLLMLTTAQRLSVLNLGTLLVNTSFEGLVLSFSLSLTLSPGVNRFNLFVYCFCTVTELLQKQ